MRLIDADELKHYLETCSFCHNCPDMRLNCEDKCKFPDGLTPQLEVVFDEQPTVDAVPVVRCGECKHSREKDEDEKKYLVDSVLICTSCDATDDCWSPVFPEHFCSYGERKDHE